MKVAILGCGIMGSAFARQFALAGHEIILCDRHPDRGQALAGEIGATYLEEPKEAVENVDVVLLAIKPKDLENIAEDLESLEGQVLISILAGTSVEALKKYFTGASIVRSMPNLALTVSESVIALVKDPELSEEVIDTLNLLLKGLGLIFWTEEEKIDAITALAGSGPAFVIVVIESMIESGIMMGLRADEAQELALQTVLGAVALLKIHEGHPGDVRWQIAAPGGTTIAGLHALEKSGVRAGIMETILATFRRTKELL